MWAGLGVVGDAAVAEAVLEAPKTAEGNHEDDTTCPEPKSKCPDCAGMAGMCTTGTAVGCGCDNPTCPAELPSCGDATCAGSNGELIILIFVNKTFLISMRPRQMHNSRHQRL